MKILNGPPEQKVGANACERHRKIDRLGDVVVRPQSEGFDDVISVDPACHHDDGQFRLGVRAPKVCEHVQPAHAWHPDIQQNQIVLVAADEGQRLLAIAGYIDQIVLSLKRRDRASRFISLSSTTRREPRLVISRLRFSVWGSSRRCEEQIGHQRGSRLWFRRNCSIHIS